MGIIGALNARNTLTWPSSNSLKVNQEVGEQLLTSVPSTHALHRIAQSACTSPDEPIPYLNESQHDIGLTLRFDEESFEEAYGTSLAALDLDGLQTHVSTPPATETKYEEGKFTSEPVHVDNGVAMLEESVALGVLDVITQI